MSSSYPGNFINDYFKAFLDKKQNTKKSHKCAKETFVFSPSSPWTIIIAK